MNNIESVIIPKSIAVVGATNRPGSVGLAVCFYSGHESLFGIFGS
jgi:hypothetical protein